MTARRIALTVNGRARSIEIEPHHTPWAPSAMAAAIWRPDAIPPAASTGAGATASTTSGTSTMVATSPV